ncbi:hypothetical protein [Arsukibacterium sp.]|uniref:hypothetical protein n=1 Tax=Arsukibacterium sp. TaxID=1977258 RepID=UPI001BD4A725|nr:hypothetical protein [Arsukibacterium sp.]
MEELKHSGLGIASFITSIASGILIFVLIVIAGIMEVSTPGGIDENSADAIIVGLCVLAFLGTSVVAFGLGIGSLVQKNRKKILGILGTTFSALIVLGTVFLIVLGLSME